MALLLNKPSQDFQGLNYNASLSLSLSLRCHEISQDEDNQELNQKRKRLEELGTNRNQDFVSSLSCSLSMACHEIPYGNDDQELNKKRERSNELGTRPNPYVPSSKKQKRRIGDKEVTKFMQSRLLPVLDPKPIAQFDGKEVVQMVSAGKKYECTTCDKSFATPQALGGHRSIHYVRDNNDPKQGNHVCDVCTKSFPTGRALGGHKRLHYNGVIVLKRKAPTTTTRSRPASQENSTSQSDISCVKLFGFELKKAQEDEEINLDLTL